MDLKDYESIVNNTDSPTLVLAGPGAGKTYLLSDRVVRLLGQDVGNNKITVLTFGKDASKNMRDELLDPSGHWKMSASNLPKIATLHSLGFEIINENPRAVGLRKAGLTVQHSEQVKELIYRDAAYILDFTKENAVSSISCKVNGDCKPNKDDVKCRICNKYWEIMAKCDRIDFDDQILFACRILEGQPDILARYQERAKHLLVDEYQDINEAQHKLIELLSKANRNGLFVVGDDAQSIYSFRGASPRFILNFSKYYNDAITPPLPHSRRCPEKILRNAEKVLIANYKNWMGPYDITFHHEIDTEPVVKCMPSDKAEAKYVTLLAKKYSSMGMDVLVLAPKKELFVDVTTNLTKLGVSHVCPINLLPKYTERRLTTLITISDWIKESSNNFSARLAIEALIDGGEAKIPGKRITSRMKQETIDRRKAVEKEIAFLWKGVSRQKGLYQVLDENHNLSSDLKKVLEGMRNVLQAYEGKPNHIPAEFLRRMSLATGSWTLPKHFVDDLDKIVNVVASKDITAKDNVKLMTMRKAKGLQADVVIMIGLEDDIIPNPNTDVEEEARIFYVSMTRAKKKLYMLHAFKRPRNISYGDDITNKKRSRFLDSVGIRSEYWRLMS